MPVATRNRSRELIIILVTSLVMIGAYVFLQSNLVRDLWRGFVYEESATVQEIRADLALTTQGERIFLATQPAIETAEPFNEHCNSHQLEVSLLGCYVKDQMYIYEIKMDELKDSNRVTAAHELLHAVWDRLNNNERAKVEKLLEQVKAENADWVAEELELYEDHEQMEELYTRVGTKLRKIPDELEKHYQQYFQDRSRIVDYYESYQAPFKQLQAECDELRQKITLLSGEIDQERLVYDKRLAAFDVRVEEFNRCADMAGCFVTRAEFQRQRDVLEAERVALNETREALNAKIDETNAMVTEYQTKQAALGKLNDALNSNIEKLERSINE